MFGAETIFLLAICVVNGFDWNGIWSESYGPEIAICAKDGVIVGRYDNAVEFVAQYTENAAFGWLWETGNHRGTIRLETSDAKDIVLSIFYRSDVSGQVTLTRNSGSAGNRCPPFPDNIAHPLRGVFRSRATDTFLFLCSQGGRVWGTFFDPVTNSPSDYILGSGDLASAGFTWHKHAQLYGPAFGWTDQTLGDLIIHYWKYREDPTEDYSDLGFPQRTPNFKKVSDVEDLAKCTAGLHYRETKDCPECKCPKQDAAEVNVYFANLVTEGA